VAVITVFTNLATAVIIGVIASALVFAWKQARHIYIILESSVGSTHMAQALDSLC